jgi:hypothetical protein
MAIYTGYFDESGDENDESFLLGGISLGDDHVAEFDRDWAEVVGKLPQKEEKLYFHTTDFLSGNDVYNPEWKGRYDEKREILIKLTKIMARYGLQFFSTVLEMEAYAAVDAHIKFGEAAGHPYAMACRIGDVQLRSWANRNSILSPPKMIVENRAGKMGEVVRLFEKDLLSPPVIEDKSTPALQAADLIAWMRLRKRHPTPVYESVKVAWREIPKYLVTDQVFGLSDMIKIARGIIQANDGKMLPLRSDPNHIVQFPNRPRETRQPFNRKPRKRPDI